MSEPMAGPLTALMAELEAFGQENDATITDRPERMLNIARDTGEFLSVLVHHHAAAVLRRSPDASVDLIFLDSERTEYPGWWPDLKRVLRPGGLLVADNATSHPTEMAPFVALVTADPDFHGQPRAGRQRRVPGCPGRIVYFVIV